MLVGIDLFLAVEIGVCAKKTQRDTHTQRHTATQTQTDTHTQTHKDTQRHTHTKTNPLPPRAGHSNALDSSSAARSFWFFVVVVVLIRRCCHSHLCRCAWTILGHIYCQHCLHLFLILDQQSHSMALGVELCDSTSGPEHSHIDRGDIGTALCASKTAASLGVGVCTGRPAPFATCPCVAFSGARGATQWAPDPNGYVYHRRGVYTVTVWAPGPSGSVHCV